LNQTKNNSEGFCVFLTTKPTTVIQIKNYINGTLVDAISNQQLDNIAPATGKVFSQLPDSDERDVAAATQAAKNAFSNWSNLSAEKRGDYLIEISKRILEKLDFLAQAESMDSGKPLWLAKQTDIPRAASNFKFFGTGIQHFASESHYMEETAINYTLRRPIGVAGCISPWNLPLYLFTWKIAPALAAGNTVVAKPSELTPLTAFYLSEICMEVGLPPGVLNIVHGLGAKVGAAIVKHPEIPVISFTGGTKTGEEIARTAGPMFKKLSLELGGKNPFIVFNDATLEDAVNTAVRASFTNQGQICLCGSRLFVQRDIYETFKNEFLKKVEALQVGNPADDKNFMGALVSKQHLEKIESYVHLAQEEGGTILTGGHRIYLSGELSEGYFYRPTVIEGLSFQCRTNQEEIFGPVVTLQPFDTEEEVLEYANSTSYGLASSIWTNDVKRAHRIAEKIKTGIVWVNCWMLRDLRTPFGGMKSSGVGREGGWEALRFFTEPKNVCIKL
jgi:aminomuconate-semialdehyde/2-hydroxymuconate-6-semialdehyde dehydrogenase